MLILVCGSRTWTDVDKIKKVLLEYAKRGTRIIQGGAKGADQIALTTAINLSMECSTFLPNYDRYPTAKAPLMRNLEMLDQEPDLVIAFQVGKSRGTQHTINHARKRGIPVMIVHP